MNMNITQSDVDMAAARFHARWRHSERPPSEKELAEWISWLQASPEHVKAAFDVDEIYERVGESRFIGNFDVDAWLSRGRAAVIPLPASVAGQYSRSSKVIAVCRRWRARTLLAAACVALFALVAVVSWQAVEQPSVYSTGIGQQLTFQLADGSVLRLNTRSRARVSFDDHVRIIDLEGEGLFEVSHDATRPFLVRTRSATARATGTRFNVYARQTDTTVSVVEGTVQVTPASATDRSTILTEVANERTSAAGAESNRTVALVAGEEALVLQGVVTKSNVTSVTDRVAWLSRALVFEQARLADVAAEFNRYNERQFQIDPKLADQRLSGTFDARYPRSLVLWLQNRGDLQVRDQGDVVIVEPK